MKIRAFTLDSYTLYLLNGNDSWQMHLLCFINEDNCSVEGGTGKTCSRCLGDVITQCIKMYDTRELVGRLSMWREQK